MVLKLLTVESRASLRYSIKMTKITRPLWTQKERIDMLRIAKQLSSITPYVKAKHLLTLWESNRTEKAVYAELNRCKKASAGRWNNGDDNEHTVEKVNIRRAAMRYVGFPFVGPTKLTRDTINTNPPEASRELTGQSRSETSTDVGIRLPQVKANPETPAEKLVYLIAEDRYKRLQNGRQLFLLTSIETYNGHINAGQEKAINEIYDSYVFAINRWK